MLTLKKQTMKMMAFEETLCSLFVAPRPSGIVIGLLWTKGEGSTRNVHLTYYLKKDGKLNCHIKDRDVKVWEDEISIDELREKLLVAFEKCRYRWKPNERVFVLDPRMLEMWKRHSTVTAMSTNVDMVGYLIDTIGVIKIFNEGMKPLGDLVNDELVFGIRRRFFRWWFVFAGPNGEGVRFRADPSRSPLATVPLISGLYRFFDYIEQEGLLKDTGFDEESVAGRLVFDELQLITTNMFDRNGGLDSKK
jgi:hypothetical protein